MKIVRNATILSLSVLISLTALGCGKEADETIPVSEVKAEADQMDTNKLKSAAMRYKEAITAKTGELERITTKLKEIPVAEMLGEEAKRLKADIDDLNKSVSALRERFDVYLQELRKKGGDTSGLEI
jgi:predicted  nucleic acid-binding Zn-ribbon protein